MGDVTRILLVLLLIVACCGGVTIVAHLWRSVDAAAREVDDFIDGTAPPARITVRRADGVLVTATLDPQDPASIARFLDAVRVPEPRATTAGEERE